MKKIFLTLILSLILSINVNAKDKYEEALNEWLFLNNHSQYIEVNKNYDECKNCIIGAKALITENKVIPDNSLVVGSPGKVVREVTEEEKKAVWENTKHYQDNWKKYSKSIF